jgi:hypothetical protein
VSGWQRSAEDLMYVGQSSLQTSAAAPLPPPCLAVLVVRLSEISGEGEGERGDGGWGMAKAMALSDCRAAQRWPAWGGRFPVPRPSELGEGRLSCEFWNDEERPGGPKVLAFKV